MDGVSTGLKVEKLEKDVKALKKVQSKLLKRIDELEKRIIAINNYQGELDQRTSCMRVFGPIPK